ncbi:hypothetical protein MHYP_G00200670 [Metynnis hypsauchen]
MAERVVLEKGVDSATVVSLVLGHFTSRYSLCSPTAALAVSSISREGDDIPQAQRVSDRHVIGRDAFDT